MGNAGVTCFLVTGCWVGITKRSWPPGPSLARPPNSQSKTIPSDVAALARLPEATFQKPRTTCAQEMKLLCVLRDGGHMGQTLQVEPSPHSTLLLNGQELGDGRTAMSTVHKYGRINEVLKTREWMTQGNEPHPSSQKGRHVTPHHGPGNIRFRLTPEQGSVSVRW